MRGAGAGLPGERGRSLTTSRRISLDTAIVPGLLLLVARDLVLFDAPRVLAWRLLHDVRFSHPVRWLAPLLPTPSGDLDRDPIALLLAGAATILALIYAGLGLSGGRRRARATVIVVAAVVLIVLPSIAFIALGVASDRPYGQDGGVVQLPLALDVLLKGESPYAADYAGTILAKQAEASAFWERYGGNPILDHHAYLPGTHLVMMPFYLTCRALFGFFDPRFVTLLFYGLVVLLASRLPGSPEARLTAAGVAALNPLVYWHQIFGANDLVFVAILLGTVLAVRRGRLVLAGILLGLGCAVKQLAWPFAPFLLVAMSGARGWRDLLVGETWRRLATPALVAALVFLAIVAPVAALDFDAFWGDIVVYNVGLPGADNYPLGGTPGFGFANYLIYFGAVASLSEHVSFSFFYIFLIPLGLLLVHRQLGDGRPDTALVTGSIALVAAVYFSRVVHPNYLVPAAVLLPVGVLASRLRAELALVPLLLLAVAVEVAEGGVFRTTWDQAVAADLPARAGFLQLLAPRAGPELTGDALGLVFSATAAGLGVLFMTASVAGAGRRIGAGIVLAGGVLLVALPLLLLVQVGDRTGLFRAQDRRVVQAAGDARRLTLGLSPYTPPPDDTPRGRQAFATSFTLEPPAEIQPDRPNMPPGLSVVAALERLVGRRDIRLPVFLGLAALAALLLRLAAPGGDVSSTALALVLPPAALGTVFGFPAALALAALVGAFVMADRGPPWAAGLLAGFAVVLDHAFVVSAPLVLLPLRHRPGAWRAALAGAVAVYGLATLPVAVLDLGAFASAFARPSAVGAGLGVFNLLAYRGVEGSGAARALAVLAPVAALALTAALWRRGGPALGLAGLASLGWVTLAPSLNPDAVLIPILFLGLSALGWDGGATTKSPDGVGLTQA